jgi:hypothetical protein
MGGGWDEASEWRSSETRLREMDLGKERRGEEREMERERKKKKKKK